MQLRAFIVSHSGQEWGGSSPGCFWLGSLSRLQPSSGQGCLLGSGLGWGDILPDGPLSYPAS